MEMTATCALDLPAQLGEGPVWHPLRERLLWVDIMGCAVHLFDPVSGADRWLPTPSHVGTVVPSADGQAVVALVDGLYRFDLDTGDCDLLCPIEADQRENRFNDGKCDPAGRLWVGSMSYSCADATAALYRYDGSLHRERQGVTISNGVGWSPDGATMYYIDTPTRRCEAIDYDLTTGTCAALRTCIDAFPADGHPDGLCVDAEGMVWIALWGAGRVCRYDPADGALLATVLVSGATCTSACALHGGELFITTAGGDKRSPGNDLAGSLFRCTVAVPGLAPGVYPAGGD